MYNTPEKALELARRTIRRLEQSGVKITSRDRAVKLAAEVFMKWFEVHQKAVKEAESKLSSSRSDAGMRKQLFKKYYREAVDRIIA